LTELLERRVASYITGQYVIAEENTTVADAVKSLPSKKSETIIVTSNGVPVGIVTDSDVLEKVVMKGEDSDLVYLKNIMNGPVITLSIHDTVKEALEVMRMYKIKRIPIVDLDKNIVGLVTQQHLAEVIRNSVIEKTFRSYRISIRHSYKPIFGNIGFVMQFAAVLMIIPAIYATVINDVKSAVGIYLTVVSMSLSAFILTTFGEKAPLNLRQSSIVVVSSFVLLSLFGSLPYLYVNPFFDGIKFFDLLFSSFLESASGFTTTGISMLTEPENLTSGFSFYRTYTLWIGGLSFVYLVMALYYPETKLAAMRNVIGGGILKFRQLLSTVTIIFVIYSMAIVILLLLFGNLTVEDSVSLSFATLTSGGFIPQSNIFSTVNSSQLAIIMIGMIMAALPFAFHYGIFRKEIKFRSFTVEILFYFLFIFIMTVLLLYVESKPTQNNWIIYVFHAISASSTTGFQFLDLSALSEGGKIILMILMFVGGTAFSTAGGIKIARILILFSKIREENNPLSNKEIHASFSSVSEQFGKHVEIASTKSKSKLELSKRYKLLYDKAFQEALIVIFLFIFFSFFTASMISYLGEFDFMDSLFESISTITNTGLSVGITTLDLDPLSKILISVNMIFGRFEIIGILYIFVQKIRK